MKFEARPEIFRERIETTASLVHRGLNRAAAPQPTRMAQKKHLAVIPSAPLACLAFCACSFGQNFPPDIPATQSVQGQSPKPSPPKTQTSQPGTAPAPSTPPSSPSSLLDHPPQPAKVSLGPGKLTVQADNSSLSEILHQISQASGMKVEGLQAGGSQRVFGSYGPGSPRDVLSDLLDGAGYNVLMLGVTSSGAPRELALTVRPNGAAPAAQPQPGNINHNDDSEGDVEPMPYPDEGQQNVSPPPGTPEMRRTPQQMLQDLERQRQEQQNQQVDQQPN
jgi:hypothetical protein